MAYYDWNDGWQFAAHFTPALCGEAYSGPALADVRIPHTVQQMPYNYCNENDYQLVSGYRRSFFAPPEWEGRTVLLEFEGVAHDATVYCNGQVAARHACGYTAFSADLTGMLRFGAQNVVAVRCDSRESLNIPPFGKPVEELTYGGIYRPVRLAVKDANYLANVYIDARADGSFRIYAAVAGESVGCALRAEIRGPAGPAAVYEGAVGLPITGILSGAQPWSCAHPTLYTLVLQLLRRGSDRVPGRVIDEQSVRFGFRTIQFGANGLLLNGERIALRGLCRSQSYPYQGWAMPAGLQRLDAQILRRDLGCNAVRTPGYPPSQAFLDACDELGLLVFAEMPGWRYVGDAAWRAQALQNCREMVLQCRNHPSVFLWGVRVPESADCDEFYRRTNEAVRRLDPSRPTAGVRFHRKGHLQEDVYAYNDYSWPGAGAGCEPRSAVAPGQRHGYLISGCVGQKMPAKAFDREDILLAQALAHASVLSAAASQSGIAGCFGTAFTDYNVHKEFGSGDRMAYYGVTDAFRTPKLAAAVYASQKPPRTPADVVLAVSSSMEFGDHPGGFGGPCWVFTNADQVRLYKNNEPVAIFTPSRRGPFGALPHPPVQIDDLVGSLLEKYEGLSHAAAVQLAGCLNEMRSHSPALPPLLRARFTRVLLALHMSWEDGLRLYEKYIGVPGAGAVVYRFEAIWRGRAARAVLCGPVQRVRLECTVRTPILTDGPTWDCAAITLRAIDQNGSLLRYCTGPVQLHTEGPVRILGPQVVALRGGMAGVYLATTGSAGRGVLHCQMDGALDAQAAVVVRRREPPLPTEP